MRSILASISLLFSLVILSQPTEIQIHLDFEKSKDLLVGRIEFLGLNSGNHTINTQECSIVQAFVYRKNLKAVLPPQQGSSAVYTLPYAYDRLVLHFEYKTLEKVSSLLKEGMEFGSENKTLPVPIYLKAHCPIKLILSLDKKAFYQFQQELDFAVESGSGTTTYFFENSPPTSIPALRLWIGQGRKAEKQKEERQLIENMVAEVSKKRLELESVQREFTYELADCLPPLIDSISFLGMSRDAELDSIENQFLRDKFDAETLRLKYLYWRTKPLGIWKDAFLRWYNGPKNRSFELEKLQASNAFFSLSPALNQNDSLQIGMEARWLFLQYLYPIERKSFFCLSLQSDSEKLWSQKVDSLEMKIWQRLFLGGSAPKVTVSYRHEKEAGRFYILTQQVREPYVKCISQVEFYTKKRQEFVDFPLQGENGQFMFLVKEDVDLIRVDPSRKLPIHWIESKSDVQLLTQLNLAKDPVGRYEAIVGLLQTNNPRLFSTIVGIGLDDEWSEIRLLSLRSCEKLDAAGWLKVKDSVEKMSENDSFENIRKKAQEALEKRKR